MPEGLHECGTGRMGLPCPEPKPNNFNLVLYHMPDLRLDWDRMGFLPENLPPRKGSSRGGSLGLVVCKALIGIGKIPRGVRRSLRGLSGEMPFTGPLTSLSVAAPLFVWIL